MAATHKIKPINTASEIEKATQELLALGTSSIDAQTASTKVTPNPKQNEIKNENIPINKPGPLPSEPPSSTTTSSPPFLHNTREGSAGNIKLISTVDIGDTHTSTFLIKQDPKIKRDQSKRDQQIKDQQIKLKEQKEQEEQQQKMKDQQEIKGNNISFSNKSKAKEIVFDDASIAKINKQDKPPSLNRSSFATNSRLDLRNLSISENNESPTSFSNDQSSQYSSPIAIPATSRPFSQKTPSEILLKNLDSAVSVALYQEMSEKRGSNTSMRLSISQVSFFAGINQDKEADSFFLPFFPPKFTNSTNELQVPPVTLKPLFFTEAPVAKYEQIPELIEKRKTNMTPTFASQRTRARSRSVTMGTPDVKNKLAPIKIND